MSQPTPKPTPNGRKASAMISDARVFERLGFDRGRLCSWETPELAGMTLSSPTGRTLLKRLLRQDGPLRPGEQLLEVAGELRMRVSLGLTDARSAVNTGQRQRLVWPLEAVEPALIAEFTRSWTPQFNPDTLEIELYGLAKITVSPAGQVSATSLATTEPQDTLLAVWYAGEATRECDLIDAAQTLQTQLQAPSSNANGHYLTVRDKPGRSHGAAANQLRQQLWERERRRSNSGSVHFDAGRVAVSDVERDLPAIIAEATEREQRHYLAAISLTRSSQS